MGGVDDVHVAWALHRTAGEKTPSRIRGADIKARSHRVASFSPPSSSLLLAVFFPSFSPLVLTSIVALACRYRYLIFPGRNNCFSSTEPSELLSQIGCLCGSGPHASICQDADCEKIVRGTLVDPGNPVRAASGSFR